jgi:biopolymer transport protein ExbD
MRIEAGPRRRSRLSVTSLIDVIFLLLLFFMLSSTFTRFAEVEFTAGAAGEADTQNRPDILLRLEGETLSVNGKTFGEREAIDELQRLGNEGARTAVILVRGEVSSQALISTVELIRRQTGLELAIAR